MSSTVNVRRLSNFAGKKLSLLFADVINQEFSPRFNGVMSPPFSGSKLSTGKTPKALTFSMFGSTDLFVGNADTQNARAAAVESKKRTRDDESSTPTIDEIVDVEGEGSLSDGSPSASTSSEICPYFLKGGCRFRKNCRLSHSIGRDCPYCLSVLPTTWTQQSKHLKKCWEGQVENEELANSMDISCQKCGMDVVSQHLMFGLLNNCIHALCLQCVEELWDNRRKCVDCPICKKSSTCVIARDRMYFDEDRKTKMFGIYMKKFENKKQH